MLRFLVLSIVFAVFVSCGAEAADRAIPDTATLQTWIRANRALVLVDVRIAEQYRKGHIPTALHIPLTTIEDRPGSVPRGNPLVLYCNKGKMSGRAQAALRKAGFTNVINFGGVSRWQGKLAAGSAPGTLE